MVGWVMGCRVVWLGVGGCGFLGWGVGVGLGLAVGWLGGWVGLGVGWFGSGCWVSCCAKFSTL